MNTEISNMKTTAFAFWFEAELSAPCALEAAERYFPAPPSGWQRLFRDTLRRLVAARIPERTAHLQYLSVDFGGETLRMDSLHADPVLDGILRRCEQRSRFTCRECGRRGMARHFGAHFSVVLCPRCAAPRLLRCAIDDTVRLQSLVTTGGGVSTIRSVPEVLRKPFLAHARALGAGRTAGIGGHLMSKQEFRCWLNSLREVVLKFPAHNGIELSPEV